MIYDERVPTLLKKEQIWFGSIIARPIDEDSKMNPIAPSGELMEIEAVKHIVPSPTLRPAQRIQIYNQQYWWRLINAMQESYPMVTRMLGFFDFNRSLSIPYLVKYPPRHWSISYVGDRLYQWVQEEYHCQDKKLIADALSLDWAFVASFIAPQVPTLSEECTAKSIDPETISSLTLYIQPHLKLFIFDYDLLKYRREYLEKNHDHWLSNKAPVLDKSKICRFALYRNNNGDISWKEIDETGYRVLSLFQEGASIDSAVEWLESQDAKIYEAALANLQEWFQEWTARGWLTLSHTKE